MGLEGSAGVLVAGDSAVTVYINIGPSIDGLRKHDDIMCSAFFSSFATPKCVFGPLPPSRSPPLPSPPATAFCR